jgi:hypothetical protein
MEDRNVSPGFFIGVMGLVGVSVVKNPNSGFHVMMARVSAKLDVFAAFMVRLLIIGLYIVAVGLVLWLIFRIACWFEELERERNWHREAVQRILADITDLKRDQLISSNGHYAIEKRLNALDETIGKLTKDPATKLQESKSASTAALSEIIGG